MMIYVQFIDYNIWKVIEYGPYAPTKTIKVDGSLDQTLPKSREEYDDEDKRKLSLNAKAKNLLYCALDRNEFNQISTCDSAYDIWYALEVTHVGTSKVKETKINMLVKEFEDFFMKQNESIVDMITRFIDIVNGLKVFHHKFTNSELVSKMLRSLSEEWSPLRTLIENTKDVNTYPLEELYGTLMTYELNNAEIKEKMRKSKEESKKPPK
ncbi:uncharacterized protein LOC111385861 [Olea europaea var. sylvestris]|uniref:uncharacterized protein LOC111385861 n=1 Tax=Olea europaea var. sylvestris TaxID=158386 RepID=UPI000C1D4B3F|nr:uncharacterized protein LOC111385861 [Olea europaea var. sylvestris]